MKTFNYVLLHYLKTFLNFFIFIDYMLQGNPHCSLQQHDNYNYIFLVDNFVVILLSLVHTIPLIKSDLGQMRSIIF
jgi:hypothetical protein